MPQINKNIPLFHVAMVLQSSLQFLVRFIIFNTSAHGYKTSFQLNIRHKQYLYIYIHTKSLICESVPRKQGDSSLLWATIIFLISEFGL